MKQDFAQNLLPNKQESFAQLTLEVGEFSQNTRKHGILLALMLGFNMFSMAQARPPQILEIYRDYLKPEAVAANRRLESRAEYLCRTLDFRHSYLTIESVSGPKEMSYFNGFESQSEVEKLRHEYAQNTKLAAALADIVQQKTVLKRAESTDEFAYYRSDLSRGEPWIIGRGQFLVIVFFNGDPPLNGTVFEIKGSGKMLVRTAHSSTEARALATSAGSTANVFRSYFHFRPKDAHPSSRIQHCQCGSIR